LSIAYRNQLLSGWGRYPASRTAVARPERRLEVADAFRQLQDTPGSFIARGSGLAYGDAALNAGGRVIAMNRLNRFFAFDLVNGLITCEAGVTLGEILDVCMPQGWFLAVTPGTARATVGGCLACDVHGKNHHMIGSFSQHVVSATILLGNSEVVTCGPDRQNDLFWATAGGMGLTGIILDATLRLQRIETAYIVARNIVTHDLEQTFRQIEETADATYSVAWLDGVGRGSRLGRGVVMLGEHATLPDLPAERRAAPLAASRRRPRSLPFGLPSGILGRPLAFAFNETIYRCYRAAGAAPTLVEAHQYFYPLDAFDNWNRLFGSRGFLEYQVVLPPQLAFDGIKQMLEILDRAGAVSFFTSVKRLGENSPGHLSFPAPGYAFSFDVPAGDKAILSLLDRCDEVTVAAGGRVYLAKDARVGASTFAAMYPKRNKWREIVHHFDPTGVLASDMSRRLELTP
jgi:decaprenylphospho-beta-D-ribofuranose 2-oxidase